MSQPPMLLQVQVYSCDNNGKRVLCFNMKPFNKHVFKKCCMPNKHIPLSRMPQMNGGTKIPDLKFMLLLHARDCSI